MKPSSSPEVSPILFVLGAPRSGTTLLRVMLDGHHKLFSPPEMVLAPFATMAERKELLDKRYWEKGGLRRALMELQDLDVDGAKAAEQSLLPNSVPETYAWLQTLLGDRMLVDKCPHLSVMPEGLTRLIEWFPNAKFLWIVRHPGSVTRSIQNMPMAEVMLSGYNSKPSDLWHTCNGNIQSFVDKLPQDRWHRIRYEDLVQTPEAVMQGVCEAFDLLYDEGLINPYEGDRMREGPSGARAIGDPNMAGRGRIQPELATKWLKGFDPRSVGSETRLMAKFFGYDLDSMALPPIARLGDAMGELWRTAAQIEKNMDVPAELDAVEGRRFLLRMLSSSIEMFVEHGDYNLPTFEHSETPHRKMFGDNPDADYLRAPIRTRDGQQYRLWGNIPKGTLYVSIQLYGKGGRVANTLTDHDLNVAEDGSFEATIGVEPGVGAHLKADGDENAVIVRQYFTNRQTQPAIEVNIEKVGGPGPSMPLDAEELAKKLALSKRMLEAVVSRSIDAYKMVQAVALLKFAEIPAGQLFPTPDNRYRACWYRFGYDQVMFVRGQVPQSRYFSMVIYNTWMESLDYTRHQVCLNHDQIKLEEDGTFELCLAHRDPGHKNWLDTTQHHAGYLVERVLLPEGEATPIEIEVMYEKEWINKRDA